MNNRMSWDEYSLKLAQVAALRSEDPWKKVGSCILRKDKSVAGIGFNGAPPGIEIDWSNREERRLKVVHSEINALAYTTPGEGELLAVTMLPCPNCLVQIARYGIKKIVYIDDYSSDSYGSKEKTLELAKEFDIEIKQYKDLKLDL